MIPGIDTIMPIKPKRTQNKIVGTNIYKSTETKKSKASNQEESHEDLKNHRVKWQMGGADIAENKRIDILKSVRNLTEDNETDISRGKWLQFDSP